MRIVRIYHGGRDAAHRERDRALIRAGVDLTLVVPTLWADDTAGPVLESFEVLEVPVLRRGDVNRHRFADPRIVSDLIARLRPDVVDFHEEPVSSVVHQMLRRLPVEQPVVTYTAQNMDKRFPPPFARWERNALGRAQGMYPCTRQAASVIVGKGFTGAVRVLPLAPSAEITVGDQRAPTTEINLLLVGRLVPRKGVRDAVQLLAQVRKSCPATLLIVGRGPEAEAASRLADELGVSDFVKIKPWAGPAELAEHYRHAHILLAPSISTRTWVEQFGRMVGEAQAAGAVVVGYASGSLPEVVGDAGVLVPEGDVDALTRAVLELHECPERWLGLRNAGLFLADGRTWDRVAAGQIDLYEEALEIAPTPTTWLPRRMRPQRGSAVLTFGVPAQIAGGGRPFALPVLRNDNAATRFLGRAIDWTGARERSTRSGRLNVVYLDHVARLSGGELALARLIGALPGINAHVILGEDGPLRNALTGAGATVEVLALNPSLRDTRRDQIGAVAAIRSVTRTLMYVLRLAHRLRVLRPDVVHTNSLKSGFYGSLAARLAGRPVVWHVRDRIAADYLPIRMVRVTRAALKWLPDFVVGNSEETLRTTAVARKVTRAHLSRRVKGWRVIGGVITEPARCGGVPPVHPDGLLIGMVGRLAPWKGQDVFIRAFNDAFRGVPGVRGRIIGSAMFGEEDYARSLVTLVDDLELGHRIRFAGFSADVDGELAELDILVHASIVAEPFGQVVLEGMAAGLPVVASAAGGPLEIITDQLDGLLTAPGQVDELAAALRTLAGDPELRMRLGQAARQRAKDFSPAVIGKEWQNLYQELSLRSSV